MALNNAERAERAANFTLSGQGEPLPGEPEMFVSGIHAYGSTMTFTLSTEGSVISDLGACFYTGEYYATPFYEAWYFPTECPHDEKYLMMLYRNASEESSDGNEIDPDEMYCSIYPGIESGLEDVKYIMINSKLPE